MTGSYRSARIANAQSLVFLAKFSGLITRRVSEGPSPGKTHMGPSLTLHRYLSGFLAAREDFICMSGNGLRCWVAGEARPEGYGFDCGRTPGRISDFPMQVIV